MNGKKEAAGAAASGRRRQLPLSAALCLVFLTAAGDPSGLDAQALSQRLAAVRDGTVRFSFAARPGVCGNGRNITTGKEDSDWESGCESGPVRVAMAVRSGRATALRTYVGGRWRTTGATGAVTDWGTVSTRSAVDFLLALAKSSNTDVGSKAVFPATLADSVQPWSSLLAIARDATIPSAARKQAVFWLGQAASDSAARGLDALINDRNGDRSIQEQAVFALSQQKEEGLPALLRVARTHPDPEIRRKAIFWLGQSSDPRAIALFEELLLK